MNTPVAAHYDSAQQRLAEEVTRFVHGEEGLAQAIKATEGLKPGADTVLDAATLEALAGDIPSAELARDDVVGKTVVDVLVGAGLQKSKGGAVQLLHSVEPLLESDWFQTLKPIQVKNWFQSLLSQMGELVPLHAGEAKRLIKGGGARVNNVKVAAEDQVVGAEDVIEVGLHELNPVVTHILKANPVVTHTLKAPGFIPCCTYQ